MGQEVKRCLRRKHGISVVITILISDNLARSVLLQDYVGRTVAFILRIHQVVDRKANRQGLKSFKPTESIGTIEITNQIWIDRSMDYVAVFLKLRKSGSCHQLPTYVLRLQRSAKSAIFGCKYVVKNQIWREAQRRIAQVYRLSRVVHLDQRIFFSVMAPRKVGIPAQEVEGAPSSLQLHAATIGIADVFRNHFADGVLFSGQHKLIFVAHIIEIDAERQALAGEVIAQLEVVQGFVARL